VDRALRCALWRPSLKNRQEGEERSFVSSPLLLCLPPSSLLLTDSLTFY
jgi:hypothetical protein